MIALQYVSGIDEETVLRVCALHGFESKAGMEDEEWRAAAEELKIKTRAMSLSPQKLRRFKRDYPQGLYLLGTCNHLFAIDNGIIIDPRCEKPPGLDRIIRQAWKVDKNV